MLYEVITLSIPENTHAETKVHEVTPDKYHFAEEVQEEETLSLHSYNFV